MLEVMLRDRIICGIYDDANITELLFGRHPQTRLDLLKPNLAERVESKQLAQGVPIQSEQLPISNDSIDLMQPTTRSTNLNNSSDSPSSSTTDLGAAETATS